MKLCPIVEGHGDVIALPVLLRRIALEVNPLVAFEVTRPIRIAKQRLVQANELERAGRLASLDLDASGAVLVVMDSERPTCPAQEGPQLLMRLRAAVPQEYGCAVVLAHQEAEAWFLAAAASLAGERGLPTGLQAPADPEGIRGAKEWLSRHMPPGRRYSETLDQPAFAARMSLVEARTSDSFDKLWREMARLLDGQN